MKKCLWIAIFLSLITLAGCGSNTSAEISYINVPVAARVVNDFLNDTPIAGVQVSYLDKVVDITDETGAFALTLKLKPKSNAVITFTKDRYAIEDLRVRVSPEGTIFYDKIVPARLLLYVQNVSYTVETVAREIGEIKYSVLSPDKKYLYFTQELLSPVFRLDLLSGEQVVLAGKDEPGTDNGSGNEAAFRNPFGIAITSDGDTIYVSEWWGCKIRKITGVKGAVDASDVMVSTIAGTGEEGFADGSGNEAQFYRLSNLLLLPGDDTLYVCDSDNHRIRKVSGLKKALGSADVTVSTLAGNGRVGTDNGLAYAASFESPRDLAISSDGDTLYVSDASGEKLRKITGVKTAAQSSKVEVFTIAGSGEDGDNDISEDPVGGNKAKFSNAFSIALCADDDTLFLCDSSNHKIKKVTGVRAARRPEDTYVSTIAGTGEGGSIDGDGMTAMFGLPSQIALSADNSILYVCDIYNGLLRRIVARENN